MRMSDFDYVLPVDRIAQAPAEPRDSSRLMVLDGESGRIEHTRFSELASYLAPGDLLVTNDTRVTARRLVGRKQTGAEVEVVILREVEPFVYEALARPAKRLKAGSVISLETGDVATVVGESAFGGRLLRFSKDSNIRERLETIGQVPLPPYIRSSLADSERYQTVYSRSPGSAAAPTAGLHFTERLLKRIREKGVDVQAISLDVSIDTFRPVSAEDPSDHKMHGERYCVPKATAEAIERCEGRIYAVGTTTVRALEAAAIGPRRVRAGTAITNMFITPGYKFRIVDGMITNFHMPRTTMLLMVGALCGVENLRTAYSVALSEGYRFLSFGDAMLIKSRYENEKRRH